MLAVPPAILDLLQLRPGAKVGLSVDGGRLVVEPAIRGKHTLDDLLAQCGSAQAMTADEREWLDGSSRGEELL